MTKDKIKLVLPYVGIPLIWVLFLISHVRHMDLFTILWCELILAFGYVATILDVKTKKIPNKFILVMLVAWVVTIIPKLFVDIDPAIVLLKNSILGFVIGGGLFLLIYLISRKGLGGGDVKFIAVTGLYIGFTGVMSTMLYGSILAALTALTLLLLKKIERKDAMPLAPFLYIGIIITVFF